MSTAVDLCWSRLANEEGVKRFAYNDATDKRVTCQPGGNLTIAEGVNLETGLDDAEIAWLTQHRLSLVDAQIQQYDWYARTDPVRQSALLDLAFNLGINGLLHFPKMLSAVLAKDWPTAAAELRNSKANKQEPRRIDILARILEGG